MRLSLHEQERLLIHVAAGLPCSRLAGPAVQVVALADDALGLRRDLESGIALVDAASV